MGLFKRLFGQEDADWQTGATAVPTPTPAPVPDQPLAKFGVTGNVQTTVLQGADAKQALQGIESMTGMDLDGDGRIAGGAPAPANPLAAAIAKAQHGDVVSQLERLAALKASGALTEAEFAAEKAKLLGEPPPPAA
jgi:hypothetical protein